MTTSATLEVELAAGELRALADLSARHPLARAFVSEFRDQADVGWTRVRFDGPTNRSATRPYLWSLWYVVSTTGRAWESVDGYSRGELVRDADYGRR